MTSIPYHRGDLPEALVRAGIELLDEEGGFVTLSLRAAARRAGVSAAAPYRHFHDRTSLLSAIAAIGFRELAAALRHSNRNPGTAEDLADIAVTYVRFAVDRAGLFRTMFAEPCDPNDADRRRAADELEAYLQRLLACTTPASDRDAVATATWALVHGLAFLHLDGKYAGSSTEDLDTRVRRAVNAAVRSNAACSASRR